MPDLTAVKIPGRCSCGNAGHDALTLHTAHDQHPGESDEFTWYAHDGDLVVCGNCGKRYRCRDVGDGRNEVVEEVTE
ncbi:MAG: hypothetical protein WC713_04270 [Candidatus Methylomirabilota bacterium]